MTLDGFIANPKGECYSWINPADEARYDAAVRRCGCELVGRKTYEQYKEDFDAREQTVTYVYTNNPKFKNSTNVRFIGGEIKTAIKQIESAGFSELIVSGGGQLNGLLATERLIDEAHFSVHSLLLYEGIPLFGNYTPNFTLEPIRSNTDIPGVVQTVYRVDYP